MATFTITNISASSIHLGDFLTSFAAGQQRSFAGRSVTELPAMPSVQQALADGDITLVITPTADELASGLLQPPNTVGADDALEVAAATVIATSPTLRKAMVAGGGGSPDDVTVYAANAVPYKIRVLDAWAYISTAVGGSTVEVRDEAAGAGTVLATFDSATTGRKVSSTALDLLLTPGTLKGLFLRRSDDAVEGTVFLVYRRES